MGLFGPLNTTLWLICLLIGIPLLYLLILLARGRAALRTIEKTHIKDPNENFHEDVKFGDLPRSLRNIVSHNLGQIKECEFHEFITGRTMRLKAGRTDTYYQQFCSHDLTTLAEFDHIRVARVLAIWPVPLPFSQWIGATERTLAFETLFSNDHTLITTSNNGVTLLNMSSLHVNSVSASATFKEQWESHKLELGRLRQELKVEFVPMKNRQSYFDKGVIQRRQIIADQERRMKELREESLADIWDNKP